MRNNGKGDKPRPLSIPKEKFDKSWDKIFMKKQTTQECIEEDKKNKEMWKNDTRD
jgi:hypothetical protein